MNITDVKDEIIPPAFSARDMAALIYDRQSRLEDKYWEIERRPSKYIKVNSREGQVLIKDFLWRAVEEYGEFLEVIGQPPPLGRELDLTHAHEELADAMHFVTGLFVVLEKKDIMANVMEHYESGEIGSHEVLDDGEAFILYASMVGNTLKMKPWKQTDVLTDENRFNHLLGMYLISFLRVCEREGLSLIDLYKLYWKKSEVNLFRQRSMY